jgi:hypothetical protein
MQRTLALSTALLSVTLMFLIAIHGTIPASAGEATPNVTGKWEGTYDGRGRFGSGEITFHLRQEGNKVTGKQSVVDLIPVWGTEAAASDIVVEEEIRDGEIDGSTLHFHVNTEGVKGSLNFTLTVSGDTMTGTICGYNCGKLKLKKASM